MASRRKRTRYEAPMAAAKAWDRLWQRYMAAIRAKDPKAIVAAGGRIVKWDRMRGWPTMPSILEGIERARVELRPRLSPHVGHERWEKGKDWIVIRPRDPDSRWVWNNKREHWTESKADNNARRARLQREGWTLVEHEH